MYENIQKKCYNSSHPFVQQIRSNIYAGNVNKIKSQAFFFVLTGT